jgi:SCY1-like protein 1
MLNPNPKGRMTPKVLLDVGMAESLGENGGFFKENKLFKICEGLGNFGLMADGERVALLRCAVCQVKTCKLTDIL